jgi:predicted metal-binding protein
MITLCASCSLGQGDFSATLRDALARAGLTPRIDTVDCMSGCTRASTAAFRSPGKTAYLFGDLTAADLDDLVTFAGHYSQSHDGNLADARVLGALRHKAIARIPG